MNEFDSKAREWDRNLTHVARSEAIARVLRNTVTLVKEMKALEFGAGTGLLSFMLKNMFSEITLMDSSVEMIGIIKEKIAAQGIRNMKPVWIDLEKEDYPGKFEIIYNQMVFHHVENPEIVIKKFHDMLVPGGYMAIADLYTEDGSFHGEGFTGHKGFDADLLANTIRTAGFTDIRHKPCYTINKVTETGLIKDYPLFLLTAIR